VRSWEASNAQTGQDGRTCCCRYWWALEPRAGMVMAIPLWKESIGDSGKAEKAISPGAKRTWCMLVQQQVIVQSIVNIRST